MGEVARPVNHGDDLQELLAVDALDEAIAASRESARLQSKPGDAMFCEQRVRQAQSAWHECAWSTCGTRGLYGSSYTFRKQPDISERQFVNHDNSKYNFTGPRVLSWKRHLSSGPTIWRWLKHYDHRYRNW